MTEQMTIGKLKEELDLVLEQGLPEDTPFTIWDSRGNIKRINANSFAFNPNFGVYVKTLK